MSFFMWFLLEVSSFHLISHGKVLSSVLSYSDWNRLINQSFLFRLASQSLSLRLLFFLSKKCLTIHWGGWTLKTGQITQHYTFPFFKKIKNTDKGFDWLGYIRPIHPEQKGATLTWRPTVLHNPPLLFLNLSPSGVLVEGVRKCLRDELCSFGPHCSLGEEPFQSSTLGNMTSYTLFKLYKDNREL